MIGKGRISLKNERTKAKNVSLVEGLKHNLLIVSQVCDQGHILTFNSRNYDIRKKNSGKWVATKLELQKMYTC